MLAGICVLIAVGSFPLLYAGLIIVPFVFLTLAATFVVLGIVRWVRQSFDSPEPNVQPGESADTPGIVVDSKKVS